MWYQKTISRISTRGNKVSFPPYIYSLLPAIYFNLFDSVLLKPLELKNSIDNIKQLFEDILSGIDTEEDTARIKRRYADAHTLISVFDDKVENCKAAAGTLEDVLESGIHEDSSLYRSKVYNNLGVNHLIIEDVEGGLEHAEKSVEQFEKSLEEIEQHTFPLEYGLYNKKTLRSLGD